MALSPRPSRGPPAMLSRPSYRLRLLLLLPTLGAPGDWLVIGCLRPSLRNVHTVTRPAAVLLGHFCW